jgi:hypothetical protein
MHFEVMNYDEVFNNPDLSFLDDAIYIPYGKTGPQYTEADLINNVITNDYPSFSDEYKNDPITVNGRTITVPIFDPPNRSRSPYNVFVKVYAADSSLLCSITSSITRIERELTLEDVRPWYPSCPIPYNSYLWLDYAGFQGAGKQSTATFHGWVNDNGQYSHASNTTVDQNNGEYTDDSGGWYGHTLATANQSMAWTFIPDGELNKTPHPIGFAMGWDGSNYNYHIVTKYLNYGSQLGNASDWVYEGTKYRLSSTGAPPIGWIPPELAGANGGFKTRQPDCRRDDNEEVVVTIK